MSSTTRSTRGGIHLSTPSKDEEALRDERREQKAEELRRRAANLAAVTKHPSWPIVQDELRKKAKRVEEELFRRLLLTGTPRVEDGRVTAVVYGLPTGFDVGYSKGMAAALRYLARLPDAAVTTLEDALRQAELQRELDEESQAAWAESY